MPKSATHLAALDRSLEQWESERAHKKPSSYVAPTPTAEESEQDRRLAEYTIGRSRVIVTASLSEACPERHAGAGDWCYKSVKAICKPRRERGLFLASAQPLVDGVGQLEPAAKAVRLAARDLRYREYRAEVDTRRARREAGR